MLDWIADPQIWAALLTLTALEIVLGIDNVIFISILADRLPPAQRRRARMIGLTGALVMRLILLSMLAWIIGLTAPLFAVGDYEVSWRDLILIAGGLFLLVKATREIHHSLEGEGDALAGGPPRGQFARVVVQIMLLDLVFSIDSIVTAVGMAQDLAVMVTAVVVAMAVMFAAAGVVAGFVSAHPTVKMLALSFLMLIGVALVADGLHFHIPKGYLYFAIFFSAGVEALNLLATRRRRRARASGVS